MQRLSASAVRMVEVSGKSGQIDEILKDDEIARHATRMERDYVTEAEALDLFSEVMGYWPKQIERVGKFTYALPAREPLFDRVEEIFEKIDSLAECSVDTRDLMCAVNWMIFQKIAILTRGNDGCCQSNANPSPNFARQQVLCDD